MAAAFAIAEDCRSVVLIWSSTNWVARIVVLLMVNSFDPSAQRQPDYPARRHTTDIIGPCAEHVLDTLLEVLNVEELIVKCRREATAG